MHANINYVVFPGAKIKVPIPPNFSDDGDIAVQPRDEMAVSCYNPSIIQNEAGFLQLTNELDSTIKIKKGQSEPLDEFF